MLVHDATRLSVDVKGNGRANGAFYTPKASPNPTWDKTNKPRLYGVKPYLFAQFIGQLREVDHIISRFSTADEIENTAEQENKSIDERMRVNRQTYACVLNVKIEFV